MQHKAWLREKAFTAVLTIVGVAFLFVGRLAFYPGCSLTERVLFPFSHANVFHLAANLLCLWMIKFPMRWPVAFLISFLTSFLPSPTWNLDGISQLPTCGLSGCIFASIGMRWGEFKEFKRMLRYAVLPTLILGLAPNINTIFHLYNLFIGYLVFRLYDRKRTGNP